ncbi:MAG: STAS domain-containing protein [Bacteroidota bacterium]
MNQFGVDHRTNSGIDCLYLRGYLDAHTAPQLESALGNLVEKGKNKVVVNFNDLDYISSAGLGVFMVFIEDVRAAGGDIKLSEMKPKVYNVFDLLGFPLLFEIYNADGEAVSKFESAGAENAAE